MFEKFKSKPQEDYRAPHRREFPSEAEAAKQRKETEQRAAMRKEGSLTLAEKDELNRGLQKFEDQLKEKEEELRRAKEKEARLREQEFSSQPHLHGVNPYGARGESLRFRRGQLKKDLETQEDEVRRIGQEKLGLQVEKQKILDVLLKTT